MNFAGECPDVLLEKLEQLTNDKNGCALKTLVNNMPEGIVEKAAKDNIEKQKEPKDIRQWLSKFDDMQSLNNSNNLSINMINDDNDEHDGR